MNFALAVAIALNFWAARHVTVPCQPIPISGADALLAKDQWGNPHDMEADPATCRVYISRGEAEIRRIQPNLYCLNVAHEIGHLGGLQHTPTGVMANEADDIYAPWDCDHWKAFAKAHGFTVRPRRRSAIASGPARGTAAS